jgi:hypothetical protein
MTRTLVLVLASYGPPFSMLSRAVKETWGSVEVPDVETLFYRGGTTLAVDGNDLRVPAADDHVNMGRKTLACFEYVLGHREFDVVFRTNLSCYVDLPNLRDFTEAYATPRFYAGVLGTGPVPYASGAGYFLSRDLVELVVEHGEAWDHGLIDDVALGVLLAGLGVAPQPAPRQDFDRVRQVKRLDRAQFHFRCRTQSWRRLEDARIIRAIHQTMCRARGIPVAKQPLAARSADALVWRPLGAGHSTLRRAHRLAFRARRSASARLRSVVPRGA